MLFVAAYDEAGFGRQRTFQNHFVVGIRRCPRSTFDGENQFGGFGQGFHPGHAFSVGIVQAKLLNGFMVFGEQSSTHLGLATALRPGRQAIKGSTAPKTRTGNDVGVENDLHALARRRTRCTAAATVASSLALIWGRLRPPSSNERPRAGG